MTASSKFSLILMHDDGGTHRVRMNKGTLRLLIVLLVLSPLLGILGLWVGWEAWHTVADWHTERLVYQTQIDTLRVQLERLSALEALLEHEEGDPATSAVPSSLLPPPETPVNTPAPSVALAPSSGKNAGAGTSTSGSETGSSASEQTGKTPKFPEDLATDEDILPDKARAAVNSGKIRAENMQARMVDRRRIRASVDLYSADPEGKQLDGRTEFSLLTADGQQYPLSNEDAAFRISRFKKIVSTSTLPVAGTEVENAAVMVEVKVEGELVYRNMFSIKSR